MDGTTGWTSDTVPVGETVLGRVISATGEPLDGQGPLTSALRVPIHSAAPASPALDVAPELLETGIKALDLLAPLTRGGTLDLVGPAGVGKLVLIGELIHNLRQQRNAVAVWAGLEEHTYQAGDFVRMMEEMGVEDQTAAVFWSRDEPTTQRPRVLLAALTIAEHFRDHGQEVVFLVDKKLVPTADLAGIAPRLRPAGLAAITAVLFVPGADDPEPLSTDPDAVFHPDARVLLTRMLAVQGQYPAVDPLVSTSRLLDSGAVRTADDFFHASFIFQHGEHLEHWAQAHLLARTAADLGHPKARYQAAASYDRWLMRQGRPQKYGTNSIIDGDRWRVWDTDPATTDAERAAWDVPPWAELLARGERAFGGQSARETFAGPFVTVTIQGMEIGLFDIDPVLPGRYFPDYGIPAYQPLQPADPRPRSLPADITCWRFGNLFCAKDADGAVLCTWHSARWRILDPPSADPIAVYAALGGQPQWLSRDDAFWQRLGLATGPETCWIVGGWIDIDYSNYSTREALKHLAFSLPPGQMLSIDGEEVYVTDIEELRKRLAAIRDHQFAEVFLGVWDGTILSVLVNSDRAWMYLMEDSDDFSYVSCDAEYNGPADAELLFVLSNGQGDMRSVAETIPTEDALRALEHFFIHGERPPWIKWSRY